MRVLIVTMSLPYELQQKLEALRQEFAEVSQHRFSEIVDILSDCPERPSEEVSGLVRETLHDIKGPPVRSAIRSSQKSLTWRKPM